MNDLQAFKELSIEEMTMIDGGGVGTGIAMAVGGTILAVGGAAVAIVCPPTASISFKLAIIGLEIAVGGVLEVGNSVR